ncbi:hypothetical protein, partial [Brachyspira hyodysenteriae]
EESKPEESESQEYSSELIEATEIKVEELSESSKEDTVSEELEEPKSEESESHEESSELIEDTEIKAEEISEPIEETKD